MFVLIITVVHYGIISGRLIGGPEVLQSRGCAGRVDVQSSQQVLRKSRQGYEYSPETLQELDLEGCIGFEYVVKAWGGETAGEKSRR